MWLVTSRFTVTLVIRPWSTKIEQIGIFASHKPCKNETRKSNSAIDVVTDDGQGHDHYCTPSMTMVHQDTDLK